MLLNNDILITLNGNNVHYYEKLGYYIPRQLDNRGRLTIKRGTKIQINAKDLKKGSHEKVLVKCDYCKKIKEIAFKDYIKSHDDFLGDCCVHCRKIKFEDTMIKKYGTTSINKIPEFIEKAKTTNRERYGYDWHMQRPEYQEYLENIMKNKYGVKRPLQFDDFKKKMILSWSNSKTPTSKPQIYLYELLSELYPNSVELEVPCDKCLLDCVVTINNQKIDVEYDGWYWHQDFYKDARRDNFVKKQGYKILRIKGNKKDDIPTSEIIKNNIENLLTTNRFYAEIKM